MAVTQTSCFPLRLAVILRNGFQNHTDILVCSNNQLFTPKTNLCHIKAVFSQPFSAQNTAGLFEAWQTTLGLICLEGLKLQWIRSPCSCHEQLFISLMSRSVSYRLTRWCLAAWYSLPSFRCFPSSSDNTEELPWGVYCTGGVKTTAERESLHRSTCHCCWWIAQCDPSQQWQSVSFLLSDPAWLMRVPALAIHSFTFPPLCSHTHSVCQVWILQCEVLSEYFLADWLLSGKGASCLTDTPEGLNSRNCNAAGCREFLYRSPR